MTASYYEAPGLNWSTLKHMRTSPLARLHAMRTGSKDTTGSGGASDATWAWVYGALARAPECRQMWEDACS